MMRLKILATLAALVVAISASAFRVDTVSVAGPGLAEPMNALVVVPDAASDTNRMPSLYLLHGYGGNHTNWMAKQPRIGQLADEYGIIIITPDGRSSWYLDSPLKPESQMESFFINSLIPYVDSNYPTINDRAKRAITGLSMGGHGSLYLAGRHPEFFGGAGSMSGGVDIRPFPNSWEIKDLIGTKDQYPERWEQAAVANMVPAFKESGIALIVDCGAKDFFAEVNEQLHQALLQAEVPHDYYSRPGKHSWDYWNNAVLYHILYFNEFFNRSNH